MADNILDDICKRYKTKREAVNAAYKEGIIAYDKTHTIKVNNKYHTHYFTVYDKKGNAIDIGNKNDYSYDACIDFVIKYCIHNIFREYNKQESFNSN